MAAFLLCSLNGRFQIADIVQSIKNTDDVDAVGDGFLDEILHHVIGIMPVTQHILAPEQHLQLGVGHLPAQNTQPLPWILVEEAQAGVEGRPAPALGGVEAGFVDLP